MSYVTLMRRRFFANSVSFLFILNILACSKTPEMRGLPGPSPLPIDTIRLGNTMGVEEYRKIFQTLNRDGKLNSLKTWFESVPEKDLKQIAKIVSEELFEKAFDSNGLLQILSERNDRRGFSEWREKNLLKEEKLIKPVWNYLAYSDFVTLFPVHVSFLDLDFQKIKERLAEWTESSFPASPENEIKINYDALAREILELLRNKEFETETLKVSLSLSQRGKFERLLQSLSSLRETNPAAFLAFSEALSSFSKAQLQDLLESIKYIDDKPNGLFSIADTYLKNNPEYRRSIAREFQTYFTQGMIENAIHSLQSQTENGLTTELLLSLPRREERLPPTESFKETLIKVRMTLQSHFTINNTYDPVLNLYAYLVTKTLEENVRANLEKLKTTKAEGFWKIPLTVEKVKIILLDSATGKINEKVKADLIALGMQKTEELLTPQLSNREIFPSSLYVFKKDEGTLLLPEVLSLSLETVFALKPLVEPGVILNSLLSRLDLKGLEKSDSLLTFIHTYVAGVNTENLDFLDTLLFHKLELHKFSEERLTLVFEMYGDREDLKEKISKLIHCLDLLHAFHHAGVEGVSGLALPWRYLNELGPNSQNVSIFNKFFSAFRVSGIFKPENSTKELSKVFQKPNVLSKSLFALSQLSEEEVGLVTGKFRRLDLRKNWTLAKEMAEKTPNEMEMVLRRLFSNEMSLFPSERALTQKERQWLSSFSQSENFKSAVALLNRYGSKENYSQLTDELLKLSSSGDLGTALEFLARIQNDRMKKLSGTFLQMEKSKQLKEFLLFLKAL